MNFKMKEIVRDSIQCCNFAVYPNSGFIIDEPYIFKDDRHKTVFLSLDTGIVRAFCNIESSEWKTPDTLEHTDLMVCSFGSKFTAGI